MRASNSDGTLTPEACAARGFYRPHSGFPDWQPSTDPQEVLDEALVWACKSNRVLVFERLVKAGARAERRSLSRHASDLGCGLQSCGNRRMAVGSRRGRQSEGHIWRTHARPGNHGSSHGGPERTPAGAEAPDRARRGSIDQRGSLPIRPPRAPQTTLAQIEARDYLRSLGV